MNEAFGIMDQGYFKAKAEIIAWINESLKLNLTIQSSFKKTNFHFLCFIIIIS